MSSVVRSLTLLLTAASVTPVLSAQAAPELAPGSKVRIRYQETGRLRVQVGRWGGADAESIHVTLADGARAVSRESVERLEVPAGRRSAFWTGALFGALPGAILFGALAASDGDNYIFSSGEAAAFGAVFGFAVGGLTGGVIGALVGKTRWQQVPFAPADPPPVLPVVRVSEGRIGVGVRLTLPRRR